MGVDIFRNTCFLVQIKSSLYPAGVLCLLFPPPSLSPCGPLGFHALDSLPLPPSSPSLAQVGWPCGSQAWEPLAILACWAGGLSLSPKEQNASLSLCLSVCLSVCVRVCLPRPVFLCSVCAPCGCFPHPAHPESRSLAVLAPLQDVDVGAGEMALFECLVAGPTDVEVDWLCRGRLLQPALLKCKMHFDGRKCKLLLTSVHEDDSGVYTCKLSTAKGNCPLGP